MSDFGGRMLEERYRIWYKCVEPITTNATNELLLVAAGC